MWKIYNANFNGDRAAVAPPTPFLLTIQSGTHAAALLTALSEHHPSPDDLLSVLVESLHGISRPRAFKEQRYLTRLLDELPNPIGAEAYALTTVLAALSAHVSEATAE